jgi:beta-glucosidase
VRGQAIVVEATGFEAGALVDVVLNSTPRALGSTTADAQGVVEYDFVVPADLESGAHTLEFTGATSSGDATVVYAFTVAAESGSTAEADDPTGDVANGSLASTGGAPFGPATAGAVLVLLGLLLVAGGGRLTTARRH